MFTRKADSDISRTEEKDDTQVSVALDSRDVVEDEQHEARRRQSLYPHWIWMHTNIAHNRHTREGTIAVSLARFLSNQHAQMPLVFNTGRSELLAEIAVASLETFLLCYCISSSSTTACAIARNDSISGL